MIALLSLALKLAGVFFLCIAAVGVMRLADPFQRMHAATKAGTLGAGLVILGTMVAQRATDATVMGLLTIVFLLLTVPVAGHLLGRAAYVSGGRLTLRGGDALKGILQRSSLPLDERVRWQPTQLPVPERSPAAPTAPVRTTPAVTVPAAELEPLASVRFAVIHDHIEPVARRAVAIADQTKAELSAHVIVDTQAIETADDPAAMRRKIRERAGACIHAVKSATATARTTLAYQYDEGDPERLLACERKGAILLVLPCDGWFHHQVEGRRSLTSWEPDGLLRLPGAHRGPVLYAGTAAASANQGPIVIRDDGEDHLPTLVQWALSTGLWPDAVAILHLDTCGKDRASAFADMAEEAGLGFESRAVPARDFAIPDDIRHVRAVILGSTPRPMRTNWFGQHWCARLSPSMKGDVLIMERHT